MDEFLAWVPAELIPAHINMACKFVFIFSIRTEYGYVRLNVYVICL